MRMEVVDDRQRLASDGVLMDRVLKAYKPHCRYLKSAELAREGELSRGEFLGSDGAFAIPESCYIDDTGHFNSVEFNICYNQLMYYTIAKSIQERASSFFAAWTLDLFWEKQLPDILIVEFRSRFKRPINPRRFQGAMEFTKCSGGGNFMLVTTQCRFWDEERGFSEGAVNLAIVNAPK